VTDELARWAAGRAPELLARAEAEAVAVLRDALVAAALPRRPHTTAPARQREEPTPLRGDALWTYCVLRAGAPPPTELEGVEQGPVERVEAGELAALVSRVPLADFGEEPLRRNLNDLPWLERVARAHEEVLERALQTTTIAPLRLCTIYESEAGVRAMLERESASFLELLERLEGRQEWGVKLLLDAARLTDEARARSPEADTLEAQLAESSEGGAYMLRRRLERHLSEVADSLAAEVARHVHARVQDWAVDAVTRPAQNRDLSGHEGEMVLNGAYLIEADRVEGLRELVGELESHHRALGARIELTGPWPPYNFVPSGGAGALA
jgi:hypothetical protein